LWEIARRTGNVALKVVIKDDIIVVLWLEFGEAKVLCKERHHFRRWPVIGQLHRLQVLVLQHGVKESAAKAVPLAAFMHIEIKGANWIDLKECVAHIRAVVGASSCGKKRRCNEEPFLANLQETQCRAATDEQVESLAQQMWRPRRHRFPQALSSS
jgi:hypothetical protein